MVNCKFCSTDNSDVNKFCSECGGSLRRDFAATETHDADAHSMDSRDHSSPSDSCDHGQFLPGTRIVNRYRIVSLIGKGGMGEVYRADDLKLGLTIALKFLPKDLAGDAKRLAYFHAEVRLARKVSHPNVCRVYDIGEVDGQHFLSMEYVDGEDLEVLLRRIGRLPIEKGLELAQQLCAGMAAAHQQGVLHRDLKPANIMIDGRGLVRITDFGLAMMAQDASRGNFAGTPRYMAPEQRAHGVATIQSDLYSFALVLFEVLTGKAASDFLALGEDRVDGQEFSNSLMAAADGYLNPALHRVISRCLLLQPNERPESARTIAMELAQADPPDATAGATLRSTSLMARKKSAVAVLPFVNRGTDEKQEFFGDGLADELINLLATIDELHVVARSSAFSFKGQDCDIREIGRQLNVDTILEGSVRWAGERLRITAQAVDVRSGYQIWSERFDRTLSDIFDIQQEIALAIVQKLKGELDQDERQRIEKRPTADVEAYELYLKGRFYLSTMDPALFEKGLEFQQLAIEKDAGFQLAYVEIAEAYCCMAEWSVQPAGIAYPEALKWANRALTIDEASAEANAVLGSIHTHFTWNWIEAEQHLRRAVVLNPNLPMAHNRLAEYLRYHGYFDEAIEHAFLARNLDPLALLTNWNLAVTLGMSGRSEQALSQAMKTVEMFPQTGVAYFLLAVIQENMNQNEAAIETALTGKRIAGPLPELICVLGFTYGKIGRVDQATECLEELKQMAESQYVMPFAFAAIYAGQRQADSMFEYFDRAYENRNWHLIMLKTNPWFDFAREDPRFKNMLNKVGMADG